MDATDTESETDSPRKFFKPTTMQSKYTSNFVEQTKSVPYGNQNFEISSSDELSITPRELLEEETPRGYHSLTSPQEMPSKPTPTVFHPQLQ